MNINLENLHHDLRYPARAVRQSASSYHGHWNAREIATRSSNGGCARAAFDQLWRGAAAAKTITDLGLPRADPKIMGFGCR